MKTRYYSLIVGPTVRCIQAKSPERALEVANILWPRDNVRLADYGNDEPVRKSFLVDAWVDEAGTWIIYTGLTGVIYLSVRPYGLDQQRVSVRLSEDSRYEGFHYSDRVGSFALYDHASRSDRNHHVEIAKGSALPTGEHPWSLAFYGGKFHYCFDNHIGVMQYRLIS